MAEVVYYVDEKDFRPSKVAKQKIKRPQSLTQRVKSAIKDRVKEALTERRELAQAKKQAKKQAYKQAYKQEVAAKYECRNAKYGSMKPSLGAGSKISFKVR